jgi:hypothetical protein
MKIKISEDFSFTPGPRYIREGDFSAELFRREYLLPAIEKAIKDGVVLTVDVDGTAGYGKSFFEESFGGLIRLEKLDYDSIVKHLEVISNEESIHKEKIYYHLKKAHDEEQK